MLPFQILLILGLLLPGKLFAGGEIPWASGAVKLNSSDLKNLTPDPNFKAASQSQFHSSANRNITFQIDVIQKKEEFLYKDIDSSVQGADRQVALKEKLDILAGFCGSDDNVMNGRNIDESALDDCIDRYGKVMKFWKVKAFSSIGQNKESQNLLQCKGYSADGSCIRASAGSEIQIEDESEYNKLNQVPYYSTAKQLLQTPGNLLSIQDSDTWEQKLFEELKPNENDFRNYEKIYSDSNDTSSGVMEKPIRDRKGKYEIDHEELSAAKVEWEKLKLQMQSKAPDKLSGKSLKQISKINHENLTKDFSQETKGAQRSVARKLYDDARGENVDYTNAFYNNVQSKQNDKKKNPQSESKSNSGGLSKKRAGSLVEDTSLSINSPVGGYQGNEQILVPNSSADRQSYGESSVTYDPQSRPKFVTPSPTSSLIQKLTNLNKGRLNGPNPDSAAELGQVVDNPTE